MSDRNTPQHRIAYNNREYKIEGNRVILSPEFLEKLKNNKVLSAGGRSSLGFKKITGTVAGDVLRVKWSSPLKAFAHVMRLSLPFLGNKYTRAGQALEPKIAELIQKNFPQDKLETFQAEKVSFDLFAPKNTDNRWSKNNIIGGVPDGFLHNQNMVVEIKTVGEGKLDNWIKWGVDQKYLAQAQLYAYLMNAKKFVIAALFIKEEDYKNPSNVDLSLRDLKLFTFDVNQNDVENAVELIESFYNEITTNGISPEFNEVADADLLEYLRISNEDEYLEWWQKFYDANINN